MHGPGHAGGVAPVTPLQQAQHGVLEPAPGRQHGQAAGLVDHLQVAVVEEGAGQLRHGGLLPGGPLPGQPIGGCERPIGQEPAAIAVHLAGGDPPQPHRQIGMAVAAGVIASDAGAAGQAGAVAVGPALVEGWGQPARRGTIGPRLGITQPGRFRGRSAPIRCGWRCRFW